MRREESFSGPLPHPDMMAKYEALVPGFSARLLTQFESQTEHRQAIEKAVIASNIDAQRRGQHFGLVVAIFGLAVACVLGVAGKQIAAAVVAGVDLVALVTVFVVGKWEQNRTRQ